MLQHHEERFTLSGLYLGARKKLIEHERKYCDDTRYEYVDIGTCKRAFEPGHNPLPNADKIAAAKVTLKNGATISTAAAAAAAATAAGASGTTKRNVGRASVSLSSSDGSRSIAPVNFYEFSKDFSAFDLILELQANIMQVVHSLFMLPDTYIVLFISYIINNSQYFMTCVTREKITFIII